MEPVMTKRTRRTYTPEQKAALVRQHLVDKTPVSEVCNEHKLQPSVFYEWLKQFLAAAEGVFSGTDRRAPQREKELESRVAVLEARIAKKDSVIAEISGEYVALKKELGEL
jgi:transposase-like protein